MTPEAFLHTIREHPQDDGPRLVYADWLEENGDCDRAEFIRVQCELEQPVDDQRWDTLSKRQAELLETHRARWLGPWELSRNVRLRRGFLDAETHEPQATRLTEGHLQAELLLELAVTELSPYIDQIEHVMAWRRREYITRLEPERFGSNLDWGLLRRLLELDWPQLTALTLPAIEFAVTDAATLSRMPNLRRLKLRNCQMPPSFGNWQAILAAPVAERLTSLELEGTPLTAADCRDLAAVLSRATNLTDLTLDKCRLGASKLKEFLQHADLSKLRRLDLTGNPLRDSGVRLLTQEADLASLTELTLNACECGKPGVRALLDSGLLRRLTSLHLNNNFLGDATARELLNSGDLGSLQRIGLGSDLTDNGLGFIANHPTANRWRELTVQGPTITAGGLLALLRSPELTNLARLDVVGLHLELGYLPNLNRKPFLSRIRELSLAQGPLSHESVVNLLSSPSLPRLERLRVHALSRMTTADELRRRFGHRFECDSMTN